MHKARTAESDPASRMGRRIGRLGADRIGRATVWLGSAVFVYIFSALSIGRLSRFGTFAFDFGIFDQGLWLLSQFKAPFVTLRGLNLFADHSSYLMVLLTPLYWVWSDRRLLLVVSVLFLAASGPLLYAIALRLGVRPRARNGAGARVLAPPCIGVGCVGQLPPRVGSAALLLGAFLLVLLGRRGWAIALVAIALLAKEDVGLLVVPFGLWLAWRYPPRRTGLAIAGVGAAAFFVNFVILLPAMSPTGDVIYAGRYGAYGDGAFAIILGAATQPFSVIADLWTERHGSYLATMLFSLPTALAAPLLLLAAAPMTVANMLSEHAYQTNYRYHYTIYLLTVAAMAAVVGARWVQAKVGRRGYAIVVVTVLVAAIAAPGSPPAEKNWTSDLDQDEVMAALELIGPNEPVSAMSRVATHLAHRELVFRFPNPFRRLNYSAPATPYDPPADAIQWVVIIPHRVDAGSDEAKTRDELLSSSQWETIIDNAELLLLKRR